MWNVSDALFSKSYKLEDGYQVSPSVESKWMLSIFLYGRVNLAHPSLQITKFGIGSYNIVMHENKKTQPFVYM
jgi:hypothetical protein